MHVATNLASQRLLVHEDIKFAAEVFEAKQVEVHIECLGTIPE
jgi:hypothetical protein